MRREGCIQRECTQFFWATSRGAARTTHAIRITYLTDHRVFYTRGVESSARPLAETQQEAIARPPASTSFNLKQLSRILIQFRPQDRSAREFLSRIVCQRGTNPDCKIEKELVVTGNPLIEIEFNTKEVVRLDPSEMTVSDIVRLVSDKSSEMDMIKQLKAAGLADHTFEIREARGASFVGEQTKIPRQ